MAKSPKTTRAVAMAAVFTVEACVDALAGVVASAEREIRDFTAARKGRMLTSFCDALQGCPEVTEAAWKEVWAAKLKAALVATGAYTDGSVGFMVSTCKVAVIGITNRHAVPAGCSSLRDYADKMREPLAKAGLLTPVNRAPRQGTTATAPTTKPGSAASVASSVTEVQALRLAFAKCGTNPTEDRLVMLAKILRQHPTEFWAQVGKIHVIS